MKQLALVSIIVAALFGALALPAGSQTADGVDAVVTPFGVAISINETQVDFETLNLSQADDSRTYGMSNAITVFNDGSAPADLVIQGSHAIASTGGEAQWTLDCSDFDGLVGPDRFVLQFALDDPGGVMWDSVGESLCPSTTKPLQSGVLGGGDVPFRLRIGMPTSTQGFSTRTTTVTVTATQAP